MSNKEKRVCPKCKGQRATINQVNIIARSIQLHMYGEHQRAMITWCKRCKGQGFI